MFRVRHTPTFERDFKKLDPLVARRVIAKVDWLALQTQAPGILLSNLPKHLAGLRKYRVGDWRVLFWVEEKEVILYGVDHRGSVYKNLF